MTAKLAGRRVLLVDDEAAVRESLSWLLGSLEMVVVEAGSGVEALEQFRLGAFDYVLTDYNMPGMRGDELARKIKSLNSKQCVVMLTGFSSEVLVNGRMPPELNCMLEKPCARNDLVKALVGS